MVAKINETSKELSKSKVQQPILENSAQIKRKCENCGITFYTSKCYVERGGGKYCSRECFGGKIEIKCEKCGKKIKRYKSWIKHANAEHQYCSKECANRAIGNEKQKIICINCKKEFETYECLIKNGRKFCTAKCKHEYETEENSSNWKGGKSFEPYCMKFNNQLKEKIRNKHENKCFLCKKTSTKTLHIHHVDYNKSQGCKGLEWSLIPLHAGCHTKTNFNRWYWFALLRDYWIYETEIFKKIEMIVTM
jgi:uncharacterized C2H2 Zn-finger protein